MLSKNIEDLSKAIKELQTIREAVRLGFGDVRVNFEIKRHKKMSLFRLLEAVSLGLIRNNAVEEIDINLSIRAEINDKD